MVLILFIVLQLSLLIIIRCFLWSFPKLSSYQTQFSLTIFKLFFSLISLIFNIIYFFVEKSTFFLIIPSKLIFLILKSINLILYFWFLFKNFLSLNICFFSHILNLPHKYFSLLINFRLKLIDLGLSNRFFLNSKFVVPLKCSNLSFIVCLLLASWFFLSLYLTF